MRGIKTHHLIPGSRVTCSASQARDKVASARQKDVEFEEHFATMYVVYTNTVSLAVACHMSYRPSIKMADRRCRPFMYAT